VSRRAGLGALAGGVILGLALGLVYAWLIDPVELYNTTPGLLRSDYRHDWIRLAALGYLADGDLERAQSRLERLPREDVRVALAALIESYAAQGQPAERMRALSHLASQYGVHTPAMVIYMNTPAPSPTAAPSPTVLPTPTAPPPTPTATPTPFVSPLPVILPYRVVTQTQVCTETVPRLQVWVRAAPEEDEEGGSPLPGVILWLTWPGGADRAVTGLRPAVDPGYADFTLEPGVPYALSIGEPNAPLFSGLIAQPCSQESQVTSWQIVIEISRQETRNEEGE